MQPDTFFTWHDSPVGALLLAGDGDVITDISFCDKERARKPEAGWQACKEPFIEACKQLDAYFNNELKHFDLPLQALGTEFQMQVWGALQAIPYGETCSYAAIAEAIDNPQACRAVGSANNANPITIVIPCHRVIGASGELVGYGGGLDRKVHLLQLENADCVNQPRQQALF